MPLYNNDYDATARPAMGKPTGFFENLQQGFRQQFEVDSQTAYEEEINQRWNEVLDNLEAQTGEVYSQRGLDATTDYARFLRGETREAPTGQDVLRGFDPTFMPSASRKEISKINEIAVAQGLPSFENVVEEIGRMQAEVEAQTALMSETGGFGGNVGQFIGAVGGSFTTRDPINLATLGIGGVGKTAAARVATEMGLNAGITAGTEYGAVQPNREAAGLPYRDPIYDIIASSIGAGVLSGFGEAVRYGLQRRSTRIRQEEFDGRVRAYLEANPQSPRARGALQLFEMDERMTAASPYGDSRAGLRRFTAELSEVQDLMAGKVDLNNTTAMARVLPPIPYDNLKLLADFEIVKDRIPETYSLMENAQARVVDIESRIADAENANISVSEAVRRIDEDSGNLLRSFEDDLNNPQLTAEQRADIERRSVQIVESLGVENVSRAANELRIGQKTETRRLRAQRKAAVARYKELYAEVDAERVRMNQEQRNYEAGQQAATVDLLGYALTTNRAAPLQTASLSPEVVARTSDMIERFSTIAEPLNDRLVDTHAARVGDEDLLDIGLADNVDPNTAFIDREGRSITFREIMDELAEDRKLDEAVRTCAL